MEVVLEVCDICGKKHGIMLKKGGMVFGDRDCFLEHCKAVWLDWEEAEFHTRGLLRRNSNGKRDEVERHSLERSLIQFKKAVNK